MKTTDDGNLGNEPIGRARGGIARRDSLSAEERKAIAQRAAKSRWARTDSPESNEQAPKASHTGDVRIGELEIACAVLPDGTRVLSHRGVGRALGRSFGGSDWRRQEEADAGAGTLPFFLSAKGLNPFISNDLLVLVTKPIPYRHSKGGGVALGVVASALPEICDVWLKAREAGALNKAQLGVAQKAEILMRGLAQIGIVALVDEATGYQEVRDRLALQEYLEKFLRKELAAWVRRFPDEFFRQLYRLKKWPWSGSSRRPGVVSYYIKDLVYERLGPGIVEQLEVLNPSDGKGRRKSKHHQWLTEDIGHPALTQHMFTLISFMRAEDDWHAFSTRFKRAFPKRGETPAMF